MVERRAIVDLWHRREGTALVTLVRTEGSSYRRIGARMLVAANGAYAGSISGGCLEAEVVRKAAWKVANGAVVERYSTIFDDTADIPYGLGCGGTVDLLLEPVQTPECEALLIAMEASLRGETTRVITQLPEAGSALRRTVLAGGADWRYSRPGAGVERFSAPRQGVEGNTFDECLAPPQRLFVFGAGDDARPVVRMAALLGWRVNVFDGRPQWARPERFPEAESLFATNSLAAIEIANEDAVVLMTHSYEQDRAWLTAVLPHRPRYLGLLGSRHRSALLVSEAAAELGWPVEQACEHLFAPVGLDIGGDGAEAIALATIAEIQACCEGKLGHSRRMTPELVSEQIALGGASRYLQAQCAL